MLKLHRLGQRGDTIIEVLFATTVFSLVAVGGLSIMNQGMAMAQRSLEIGLVRQQIDAQADALRYLNQAYVADYGKRGAATTTWNQVIVSHAIDRAQDFTAMVVDNKCQMPTPSEAPFALDITKLGSNPVIASTTDVATYAKVRYDDDPVTAEGVWIQAVRSPSSDNRPGFYDFHIRACWQTPGQAAPVTLGTIVRLYEPRG
jgi:type II secretory pathway pseudopilin PulG